MNGEDASTTRGQIVRGVVHRVDDTTGMQQLDVETHEGVVRSGVEVLMPYGLASTPAAGGLTVLLAVGGDQGDMIALPQASGARFGGMAPGEVAIYDDGGNRIHLRAGGVIELVAATEIKAMVGGTIVSITAAGVAITGDLTVSGQVSDANGPMQEMRDRYNAHNHGGPGPNPVMD